METSATSTAILAGKSTELTKETLLECIMDCAAMLDKIDSCRFDDYSFPLPGRMQYAARQAIRANEALAAFKKNSSYWPDQFPWCRKRHLGRVFVRRRPFYREYRPCFST